MMLHALCAFAPAWKCAPRGDLRREQRGATRCRQEHERGGSLVELAIVLSVLLLLLLGCGELSGIYKDSLVLRQAAREGVRIAAVGATEGGDCDPGADGGAYPGLGPDHHRDAL